MLSPEEQTRYHRQILMPEVGLDGQEKLKEARVLVIGAGGLGSPVAMYLCAAGVGNLGLADDDAVDITNLQRQILHTSSAIGLPKVESASQTLLQLNPNIVLTVHKERVTEKNVDVMISNYDIIVDGTDNFETRYLINDACVKSGKPNVYGSILRFEGQASVFSGVDAPCYRCLFPVPPPKEAIPNCAEAGILGSIAGIIGSIQATEALKLILTGTSSLAGILLLVNASDMEFTRVKISKNENCPSCSSNKNALPNTFIQSESSSHSNNFISTDDYSNSNHEGNRSMNLIDAPNLKKRIDAKESFCILDVRNDGEFEAGHIENAKHIPLSALQSRMNELDKSEEIVVYCQAGGRSRKAMELLQQSGFEKLTMLDEGYSTWK